MVGINEDSWRWSTGRCVGGQITFALIRAAEITLTTVARESCLRIDCISREINPEYNILSGSVFNYIPIIPRQ